MQGKKCFRLGEAIRVLSGPQAQTHSAGGSSQSLGHRRLVLKGLTLLPLVVVERSVKRTQGQSKIETSCTLSCPLRGASLTHSFSCGSAGGRGGGPQAMHWGEGGRKRGRDWEPQRMGSQRQRLQMRARELLCSAQSFI